MYEIVDGNFWGGAIYGDGWATSQDGIYWRYEFEFSYGSGGPGAELVGVVGYDLAKMFSSNPSFHVIPNAGLIMSTPQLPIGKYDVQYPMTAYGYSVGLKADLSW